MSGVCDVASQRPEFNGVDFLKLQLGDRCMYDS